MTGAAMEIKNMKGTMGARRDKVLPPLMRVWES